MEGVYGRTKQLIMVANQQGRRGQSPNRMHTPNELPSISGLNFRALVEVFSSMDSSQIGVFAMGQTGAGNFCSLLMSPRSFYFDGLQFIIFYAQCSVCPKKLSSQRFQTKYILKFYDFNIHIYNCNPSTVTFFWQE